MHTTQTQPTQTQHAQGHHNAGLSPTGSGGLHDDSGRPTFVLDLGEAHGHTISAHPDENGVVYRSFTMVYVVTGDRDARGRHIARAMWD